MPSAGVSRVPATALVLAAIASVQIGAAFAAILLPRLGVPGTVLVRLAVASLVLLLVARPRLAGMPRAAWRTVLAFGVTLGAMNACFYGALARLPIGVAVTVEFTGPLVLAAVLSRRLRDGLAVLAAAVGVVLVADLAHARLDQVDLVGLALGLGAGACWAAYIVLSGRTARALPGLDGLAVAMVVATACVLPFGIGGAGSWQPTDLAIGAGVALLSSVLPYSLELVALRRMRPEVFGVLMSLEPAVAALAGLVVLGQVLGGWQIAGMVLVVVASVVVLGRAGPPAEPDAPPESVGLGPAGP